MSWDGEFGKKYMVPKKVLALVTSGEAIDESWHNDAAPKFGREFADGRYVTLWVDHPEDKEREIPGGKRFWVTDDQGDGGAILETNDVNKAVKCYRDLCAKEASENPLLVDAAKRALEWLTRAGELHGQLMEDTKPKGFSIESLARSIDLHGRKP